MRMVRTCSQLCLEFCLCKLAALCVQRDHTHFGFSCQNICTLAWHLYVYQGLAGPDKPLSPSQDSPPQQLAESSKRVAAAGAHGLCSFSLVGNTLQPGCTWGIFCGKQIMGLSWAPSSALL